MNGQDFQKVLKRMDITPKELAKETGLSVSVIRGLCEGVKPSERTQLLIEAALDQAIWSLPVGFTANRAARKLFGKEPASMNVRELQLIAKRLGIKYAKEGLTNREKLMARLIPALEAEKARPIRHASQLNEEDKRKIASWIEQLGECTEWRCEECQQTFEVKRRLGRIPRKCRKCGAAKIWPNLPMPELSTATQSDV